MQANLLTSLLVALLALKIFAINTTIITQTVTISSSPTTVTGTELAIPDALKTLGADLIAVIVEFAPGVTTVDPTQASKLASDEKAFVSNYYASHTPPPIFTEIAEVINSAIESESIPQPVFESIIDLGRANPFAGPTASSELAALVSPYPVLSSALAAYQSVARTYEPGLILGEASVLSEDLGVTATPPAFLSVVSENLPSATAAATASTTATQGTSISAGGAAAPTMACGAVTSNAVAAAAGLVGVLLL